MQIPQLETEVLDLWKSINAFDISNKRPGGDFVFLDGPPFSTGSIHLGHLLAGTIKDVVCRYQCMMGKHVERRWGWDDHGLPIESLAQKALNLTSIATTLSSNDEVKKFNDTCRSMVSGYADLWEKTVERSGRWVDFKNCYQTMDASYMETVWWAFKQLYGQGRVYQSHRVMPYSPQLMTSVSNFEASSNYRDVEDWSGVIKFKLQDNSYALAFTTTAWSLPGNLALCVNPVLDYSYVESAGTTYLLHTGLIEKFFKDYTIIKTVKGQELVGLSYEPLFPLKEPAPNEFKILADSFVSAEEGTGIVHLAPSYGADDYRVCQANNIELFDVLDDQCKYNDSFSSFTGRFCKDIDADLLKLLDHLGLLFSQKKILHSYPFCSRTNSPLIYRAIDAWYVRLEDKKDRLVELNKSINWVPAAVGENRFGNWLKDARDWNISRNRLWGSCIPLWISDDGDVICVGSIAELEELSGVKVTDLHKHTIDPITIERNGKIYRRTPEVLDCWFESGCAFLGSNHYPFENKEYVEKNLPVDFIAEGLDQTRGFFYTQLVISALLFDKAPFKNVIVNGLILAEDGQKMSKSKNNYTDPLELINSVGADTVRGYLISSGAVHAEPLSFNDKLAEQYNKSVVMPLLNALNFYETYTQIDAWVPNKYVPSTHILDRWIVSHTQVLIRDTALDMNRYELHRIMPRISDFIDNLNNRYIRGSRKRFWAGNNVEAYGTLYLVLDSLCKLLAPFMPFVSEHVYQRLNKHLITLEIPNSVHWTMYPEAQDGLIDADLMARMDQINLILSSAHKLRTESKLRVRQPLASLSVVGMELTAEEQILVRDELNVKSILHSTTDEAFYQVKYKPNFKTLGKKFDKQTPSVARWIQDHLSVEHFGRLPIPYYLGTIDSDDVLVMRVTKPGLAATSVKDLSLALDILVTDELRAEGWTRDLVSSVQSFRKELKLQVMDRINIVYSSEDQKLLEAIELFRASMEETLLATMHSGSPNEANLTLEIDGKKLLMQVSKVQ